MEGLSYDAKKDEVLHPELLPPQDEGEAALRNGDKLSAEEERMIKVRAEENLSIFTKDFLPSLVQAANYLDLLETSDKDWGIQAQHLRSTELEWIEQLRNSVGELRTIGEDDSAKVLEDCADIVDEEKLEKEGLMDKEAVISSIKRILTRSRAVLGAKVH